MPAGRVQGAAAGVHLVLALPVALDERRLRAATAAHGVAIDGVESRRRIPTGGPTELVLGYGRVPTAGVDAAVAGLARALQEAGLGRADAPE